MTYIHRLLKMSTLWGAWLAESAEHETRSQAVSSSLTLGTELTIKEKRIPFDSLTTFLKERENQASVYKYIHHCHL